LNAALGANFENLLVEPSIFFVNVLSIKSQILVWPYPADLGPGIVIQAHLTPGPNRQEGNKRWQTSIDLLHD